MSLFAGAGAALLFLRGFFFIFGPGVRGKWNPLSAGTTAWDAFTNGMNTATPLLVVTALLYMGARAFHYLADKEMHAQKEAEASARLAKDLAKNVPMPTPIAVAEPKRAAAVPQELPPAAAAAVGLSLPEDEIEPAAVADRPAQSRPAAAPRRPAAAASGRDPRSRDPRAPSGPRRPSSGRPAPEPGRDRRPVNRPDRPDRPDRPGKGRPSGAPLKREPMLRPATEPRTAPRRPNRDGIPGAPPRAPDRPPGSPRTRRRVDGPPAAPERARRPKPEVRPPAAPPRRRGEGPSDVPIKK